MIPYHNFLVSRKFKELLILKLGLLLLILKSMYAWFTWDLSSFIVNLICSITIIIFLFQNPKSIFVKKNDIYLILIFSFVKLYSLIGLNVNAWIGGVLTIFIVSFVLLLRDELKVYLFKFFTRSLAILVLASLFGWILYLLGISFPFYELEFNEGQYFFNNHFLFLNNLGSHIVIPRFSSVFLEAGHLGIFVAFFLFVNEFQIKKNDIIILLIGLIFTFSLAAIVLLLFSWSAFIFSKSKRVVVYLVLFFAVIFLGYIFFTNLNNGDNIVNQLIIERLQVEDGEMVGNNRFSNEMDFYFEKFLKTDDLICGIGTEDYLKLDLGANAGYKVFLIQYGIVGLIATLLFYLGLVVNNFSKLTTVFFIVYSVSFLQRAYVLWDVELLIFIMAMPILSSGTKKMINVKPN